MSTPVTLEDINKALEDFKLVGCEVSALDWFMKHCNQYNDTVPQALKIAATALQEQEER